MGLLVCLCRYKAQLAKLGGSEAEKREREKELKKQEAKRYVGCTHTHTYTSLAGTHPPTHPRDAIQPVKNACWCEIQVG